MRYHIFTLSCVIVLVVGSCAFFMEVDAYANGQHTIPNDPAEHLFVNVIEEPPASYEYTTASGGNGKFFEIRAKKFAYTPNIITVDKGDEVLIKLRSLDVSHGLYIDGYELKLTVHPGETSTLRFIADKTGKFNFRCAVTCGDFHPYMVGGLVVEPNSRFSFYVTLIIVFGGISAVSTLTKKEEKKENGQEG